jgi:hypothetical protein
MSPEDRFNRLEAESKPLPENVKDAVAKLDRFSHLEIGELKPRPVTPPIFASSTLSDRTLCAHCGQPNEAGRDVCWACFKALRQNTPPKPEPGQEIQLILDGHTYKSSDPNTPDDIQILMSRIREEGYSDALLHNWREWRATRHAQGAPHPAFETLTPAHEATAFQGQRVSVLRIDGKVYQSDDPSLLPEIREIFEHIEKEGVTPELLEHLRRNGDKVKFRPHTTQRPSDGDIDFWKSVDNKRQNSGSTDILRFLKPSGFTFRQQAILLFITIGIPALVIFFVVWHLYHSAQQLQGNF